MIRKNSRNLLGFSLIFAAWIAFAPTALAQGRLRSPESMGLTPVWSKSIGTGLGGKISGVHLQISSTSTYQANDIVDRFGRRLFFSDIDTRPVSRAGYDQTQRMTELKQAELAARGLEPRVEQQSIPATTLYVRSNSGMVIAMDAETGQVKWSTKAGKQGYPSYSVAASEKYVVALSSTKMFLLDAGNGQVLDTLSTRSIPSGTPTIDGEFIYVPTWRGLIEVYSTDDFGSIEFTLGSTSAVVGTVTVCPDAISWTSDQGDLYVGNRRKPGLKYRFQSPDTISSAPAYLDGTLFATSLDGFVYAIDDTRGNVKWRHPAGGPIDASPLAIDGTVFASTRDGQLVCLDAQNGEPKWLASGIKGFISASESRLYCATTDGHLAVIDMANGSRIGSQPMRVTDLPIVNIVTDRLYMASDDGVLSCLRETSRRWPIIRQLSLEPEQDAAKATAADAEAAADTFSVSAADDTATDDTAADDANDFAAGETDSIEAPDAAADDAGDAFSEFGNDAGADDAGFGDDPGSEDEGDPFGELP